MSNIGIVLNGGIRLEYSKYHFQSTTEIGPGLKNLQTATRRIYKQNIPSLDNLRPNVAVGCTRLVMNAHFSGTFRA